MTSKQAAFCSIFEQSLSDIEQRTLPVEKRCLILSGGVDTCAILEAADKRGMHFAAAITVVITGKSPDQAFAVAAAQQHELEHFVVETTPEDLISTYLEPCVECLATFDGMTLRNSLVVAAAFRKASELGFKHVIVGDGADELFGGYSFMWGSADKPDEWKKKRDGMCRKWTFATASLAEMHGLVSHSPYTEKIVVDWALENTDRSDCIGVRPIRLVHEGEAIEHETGKLILREAYDTVASWRRKDPIEVGSGVTIIGKDDYWKDQVSNEEFEAATAALVDEGFVIRSKEYLVNFRAFQSCFYDKETGKYTLPNKNRLEINRGCAGCCFEIGDNTFCRVCGAFPAQRGENKDTGD